MTSTPHLRPASPRALAFVVLLATGLLTAAIIILLLASQPGTPLAERLLLCLLASITLLLPARIIFVTLRRYLREGRWTPSDEERLANYARVHTDSRAFRAVTSPYFDLALSCAYLGTLVWQAAKPGRHGPSALDVSLILVWSLLLAQSLREFVRKIKTRRMAQA